jgi:HAD superfamily hydrolase (TIGR01509 family)
MKKIKAILFDMDGVLIEAKDWHYEALNRALGLFGVNISRYDHLVTYDGLPTRKKLVMLSEEKGFPLGLHNFVNELKQLYTMELVYTKCKPTFIHEYALNKLRNEGYKMAVCSNSIRDTICSMMERASLSQFFEFYISNQDVTHGKPNPEIYNTAIKRMNLEPKQCMIIEDNENGIKAAKASGAWVMEVQDVNAVNYENIQMHLRNFEKGLL